MKIPQAIVLCAFTSILLCQCHAAITDEQGYVTNAAYLNPFTIQNKTDTVTNAVMVKILPNKFIYQTPAGAESIARWQDVSTNIQAEFGYDPKAAAAADQKESIRKNQEIHEAQIQSQLTAKREIVQGAFSQAKKTEQNIFGYIVQILPEGVLINLYWGSQEVLVQDCDVSGHADGDLVSVTAYSIGTYTFENTKGANSTVRAYTMDINKAAKLYLPKSPAGESADGHPAHGMQKAYY